MKQKILLALTIILFPVNICLSQEKQNDATWEETVGFLKENLPRLDTDDIAYSIVDNSLKTRENFSKIIWYYEVDLKYLKDFEYFNSKPYVYLRLNFEENTVRRTFSNSNNTDIFSHMFIELCHGNNCNINNVKNTELISRLSKAFTQLAYLAEEKRKESKF